MTRRFIGAMFLVAAGTMSAVMAGQDSSGAQPAGAAIRLRAGTFSPARGDVPAEPGNVPGGASTRASEYLVQLAGPVREEWKAGMAAAGADILEYVPDFAFRVRVRGDSAARLRQLPFVAWVGSYLDAYKIGSAGPGAGERLYLVRLDRDADAAGVESALAARGIPVVRRGRSLLMIRGVAASLSRVVDMAGVASVEPYALRVRHNEFGGGVILGSRTANQLGFDGSSQILAVADTGLGHGTVGGAHPDISAARILSIFNRPGTPDFCFDTIADDGAADVDTGHGTHVATAALGAGNAAGVGRGTAPAAGLVFQAIENYAVPSLICSILYGIPEGYYLVGLPADLGELFGQAYDVGARVHSDSWGASVAGAYTTDSENTDAFVWSHRDMAITFSAGNAGVDANADGIVDATSLGAPGTAKNVITVGASENDRLSQWDCDPALTYTTCAAQGGQNRIFAYGEAWPSSFPANPLRDDVSAGNAEQMAAFSSRGPTSDGRIKPDVVAPGTWTLSGYSDLYQQQYDGAPNPVNGAYQYDGWGFPADAAYKYMGGTSMAAPLVGGGAAVVRDFFLKARGHQASAALVKATLINTAVDLLDENNDGLFDNAYPIPNGHEGWGRVDLAGATDGTQQFSDEVAPLTTDATASYTFPVLDAGFPFKASVVWTDYPSTPTAAVHLVNDLDLTVIAPDGTTYLGNVFAGGWSAPGGTPDRVNNVENVYVPSAHAGTWTVVVTGYNVPMGPQPFALVVDYGPQGSTTGAVVRASAVVASVNEAGPAMGMVRVTRTGDTSSPLTVHYSVGGTATPDADYVALSGVVGIDAGASEATIPIEVLDDEEVEAAETVVVTLSPDDAYTVLSPGSAVVTIQSDDVPPDLVVTSVTAPPWVGAGESPTVTDTTANLSTLPAPAAETGFYLSSNGVLDAADVFLGSRIVPALAAGQSQSASIDLLIPESTPPGTYYIVAAADWNGQVDEASESNNTRASGAVRVGPDLIVTKLTAPGTAAAGGALVVTDTTKNQGAGSAPSSITAFYLSTNGSLDASDIHLGSRVVPELPGATTNVASTTLVLPSSTSIGTYYILAKADSDETVAEISEINNLRASGSVKVGTDLTMSALTVPGGAAAGGTISVTASTKNVGGADADPSTTDFYLSVNASLDASDRWLGSTAVPELPAGVADVATVLLTLPLDTGTGTYYLLAKADGPNDLAETNESNNVRASSVIKVGPDLTVLAVAAPPAGGAGEILSVSDTVTNLGGAASGATEVVLYLSTNGTIGAGDVEVARRNIPALAPGDTDTGTVSIVLPAALDTGTYYVVAMVDPADLVPEPVESNNVKASAPIKIGPDLVVSSLTGPSTTTLGSTIAVTDTTRNKGGGAAPATVTGFYLSTNGALDASDVFLASRNVVTLGAGGTSTTTTLVTIPGNVPTGRYYLLAKTDNANLVDETLENNNTRAMSLRVNP